MRNSGGKIGWICDIWVTQHLPPTELVACPHATVHKLFDLLNLVVHGDVFNNKSFHCVRHIRNILFFVWLDFA